SCPMLTPPWPTPFPYTTLFRSERADPRSPSREHVGADVGQRLPARGAEGRRRRLRPDGGSRGEEVRRARDGADRRALLHLARLRDRKSTRLNSSHQIISYAVFC